LGFLSFTGTLVIQGLHEVEHIVQYLQKNVWHTPPQPVGPPFPGLLGQWFDFENIHWLYNLALLMAVLAVWVIYRKNPGSWRRSRAGSALLMSTVAIESYHFVEHSVRMVQYVGGNLKPPGVLPMLWPNLFPVLEFHFWINLVVLVPLIIAWLLLQPRWSADGKHVATEAGFAGGIAAGLLHHSSHAEAPPVAELMIAGLAVLGLLALYYALRLPRIDRYQ
jgi:hypothetical protein